MVELFDYQKEAIELFFEGKNLNLSDVGTGKSYMSIGSFIASDCKKLLVICLAPKVADFAEDGKAMGIEITPLNKGTKKNRELLANSDMVSISFESVWRLTELLKWVDKDTFIIIDESHKVGVTKSKVTKFVMKLSNRAKHVNLCTATPVSNGKLENLYSQLYIADIFRKPKKDFYELFVIQQMRQMGAMRFMDIVGYQNEEMLKKMIDAHALRYKRDKEYLPEDYVFKTKKPAMYNKLKKNRLYETESKEQIELDTTSKLFNMLRKVSHGVLDGIDKQVSKEPFERLTAILEAHNDERVVIFYNYNKECEMLEKLLDKIKRPVSYYNGHSKDLKNFKTKDNGVVLAHYKSASTGINDFVISNVTIFNSMPLSSTDYIQAKGRTDRHGQDKTPLYYHIVPETPTELKIYETVLAGGDIKEKDFKNFV